MRENPLIMALILFMSGVNLVASAFDDVLPGYVLPNPKGGSSVLGIVTSCSGIAMIVSVFQRTIIMVYWAVDRMDSCTDYECKFGCGSQNRHSMRAYGNLSVLKTLFGSGKGSGAALMMLILGVSGSLICLITGKKLKEYQYNEE